MIEKVEMLENGKPVATDQHLAPAGPGYDNNEFRLKISTVDPSAKYSIQQRFRACALGKGMRYR